MPPHFSFPKPCLVSVNGIDLEVFEAGQQNRGNPIVLCHGWPELAFSWRHQIPALVSAGYHVIAPNQRGYGQSTRPCDVADYDIHHLTGDLVGLLDHYGYSSATFVGHDWGANVVWGLALLYPQRVNRLIALSVPYQVRGAEPWVAFIEKLLGPDNYIVHYNRHPGVADAILDRNTAQFLRNLFRTHVPVSDLAPGMAMINLAQAAHPRGKPLLSDDDLAVFIGAFEASGFEGTLNWYRNLDRNWHILGTVDPVVLQPSLMIYGDHDPIPQPDGLSHFVPNMEEVHIACGHWIQQEKPYETNEVILQWLAAQDGA